MEFQSILFVYLILHTGLILIGQVSPNRKFTEIIDFLLFFCLPIYYIREFNENNATWEILLVLIMIRLLLLGGYDLYVSITEPINLPNVIIHLHGIISGFLYLRLENPLSLLPFLISFTFVLFMNYKGWDYWLHYHKFGTFTGKIIPYRLSLKVEGIVQQNAKITNRLFENKIVLLFFWWTDSCGSCFTRFPQVQATYDKYKNDSSVAIYTIYKSAKEEEPYQIFEMIQKEGYSFPVVIPTDKELPENFGITRFQTAFIINRTSQIVYKGSIEGAVKMVDKLKTG